MVYVTGDCHGEFGKFSMKNFPKQKEMTRDDFVIVCGDFGIWHDDREERYWLKWLSEKSFTLLFADGNHENFDRLYSDEFEIVDFHGGKAHKICENVYHLMRGYVFELCGKKFFAFGGASSHDIDDGVLDEDDFENHKKFRIEVNYWHRAGKRFRVNHVSWWKQELPSEEEMEFGLKTLDAHDDKVDFIISHCCPQQIVSVISNKQDKPDALTRYFNVVAENVAFSKWFFGHYHDDRIVMSRFVLLYEQIVRCV